MSNFNCERLLGSKVLVNAFYKGTPMPVLFTKPVHTLEDWEKYKKEVLEEQLRVGLQMGVSLKEQAEDYEKQLNIIEENCNRGDKPTISEQFIYTCDVACLLKLKKIKEDNNFGFLVMVCDTIEEADKMAKIF